MNKRQQVSLGIIFLLSLVLVGYVSTLLSNPVLPLPTPPDILTPISGSSTNGKANPSAGVTENIALVNGTLIDGTGADAVPDAIVVIKGDRITAVGPRAQVNVPKGAYILDLKGGTILPGLIDAHVHYANFIAAVWAQAGVTTIRSLGEAGWASKCSPKSINGSNARIISSGPIITVENGYPIWLFGTAAALPIHSPEEASEWTTKLLRPDYCKDVIKVALENEPQLTEEELHEIVESAHDQGTIVSAHVTYSNDLKKALAAGVDDMAHMVRDSLPDELINEMVIKNVYVVPTLRIFSFLGISALFTDNVARFVAAGGKVAIGTDYNDFKFPKNMYFLEMEKMQEAGMTPMQIIIAATINGAHVSNLENEIGTIERGKMADIIVVGSNPLENLKALSDIKIVIHGGNIIRNEIP